MYECYVDDNVNHLLTSDCTAQEPPTWSLTEHNPYKWHLHYYRIIGI
jgi:hypothetical protein